MKQQTEKKLQANLKAINNDFNTVIFADIEVKFKLMELEAIRIYVMVSRLQALRTFIHVR